MYGLFWKLRLSLPYTPEYTQLAFVKWKFQCITEAVTKCVRLPLEDNHGYVGGCTWPTIGICSNLLDVLTLAEGI